MKHLILCLCLLAVPMTGPAMAAAAQKKHSVASATTHAKRKATHARPAAARSRAVAGKAKVPQKHDVAAAPARTVAGPRRLEDIHIEGEIPAPQVLFVTARDQRRFTKFHHHRYLKSSAQVGETTPLPNRIALTHPPQAPAGAP
jgi:hypothetical protein